MIRSIVLPFILILLPACPVDHVIISGEIEEGTSEPAPSCAEMSPAEICEAHPWGRPEGCSRLGYDLECADMLETIAATPACADITER